MNKIEILLGFISIINNKRLHCRETVAVKVHSVKAWDRELRANS